jgi:hypothetical protein
MGVVKKINNNDNNENMEVDSDVSFNNFIQNASTQNCTDNMCNSNDDESMNKKDIETKVGKTTEVNMNKESNQEYKTNNNQNKENSSMTDEHTINNFVTYNRIDNLEKGDNVDDKSEGDIRLIYQNINSLRPKTTDKWRATLDRVEHLKADVIGLTETCINWKNNTTTKIYARIATKI